MAAKNYKLCVSGLLGNVYIAKTSKTNPYLMSDDRVEVSKCDFIDALIQWTKAQIKKPCNILSITEGGKVVAEIKLLDKTGL